MKSYALPMDLQESFNSVWTSLAKVALVPAISSLLRPLVHSCCASHLLPGARSTMASFSPYPLLAARWFTIPRGENVTESLTNLLLNVYNPGPPFKGGCRHFLKTVSLNNPHLNSHHEC